MIAMLLLIAEPAQPGASFSALATARIVPGTRIALVEQRVQDGSAEPQRTSVIRQEGGRPHSRNLVEFQ